MIIATRRGAQVLSFSRTTTPFLTRFSMGSSCCSKSNEPNHNHNHEHNHEHNHNKPIPKIVESQTSCCGGSSAKAQEGEIKSSCCNSLPPPQIPKSFGGPHVKEQGVDSPGPLSDAMNMTKFEILSVYRTIIREGLKMPTQNRRDYIRDKARREFKKNSTLTEPKEIDMQRRMALTISEVVKTQQLHLNQLFGSDITSIIEKQKERKRLEEAEGEAYSEYFGSRI
eukprot:c18349_g1_i1.p1 GENE.c18349_g1_i1~~c18349_g1_i1.p1  ORF type:complete len:238 (+),score=100.85 c18349_g1_i1:41-715(+)